MARCARSGILIRLSRLSVARLLLAGAFGLTLGNGARAARPAQASGVMEFTAAGHVLGFGTEAVYVTAGDHVLRVGFEGTPGVTPVADPRLRQDGRAQPLGRVAYSGLWPGVSLHYEASLGGIMRSTYVLEPGADVGQIRLRYNAPLAIDAGGGLRVRYDTGDMLESAPIAWQDIAGRRVPVEVGFRVFDASVASAAVGFVLGRYNPSYPLVIDPMLQWSSFLGSPEFDMGAGIEVDADGNVYVVGNSSSTWGSPVNPFVGGTDVFVAKLDSSGVLQWNTFLGSTDVDECWGGVALDGAGNVYVVGDSYGAWGSPVNPYRGYMDAFVAKLDGSGVLQWNTFMGSPNFDIGGDLALDEDGNVYVVGSSDLSWGSPVNPHAGDFDSFVARLNGSGALQWNTFLGSAGYDEGLGIAVNGSGKTTLVGYSFATWGSPVNPHEGGTDAFVAALNAGGSLVWNTFLGSSDSDYGNAVSGDESGRVYVAGQSYAAWGSPLNPHAGDSDAFAAELNSSGLLQWNTFMGSSQADSGIGIATDASGRVYVAGDSDATWGSPINPHAGSSDAFAAALDASGVVQWNTFVGSSQSDSAAGVATDGSGNIYLTGDSDAAWGSPTNPHAGSLDAFAVKLAGPIPKIPTLNGTGLAVLLVVLLASAGWLIRRRVADEST